MARLSENALLLSEGCSVNQLTVSKMAVSRVVVNCWCRGCDARVLSVASGGLILGNSSALWELSSRSSFSSSKISSCGYKDYGYEVCKLGACPL